MHVLVYVCDLAQISKDIKQKREALLAFVCFFLLLNVYIYIELTRFISTHIYTSVANVHVYTFHMHIHMYMYTYTYDSFNPPRGKQATP